MSAKGHDMQQSHQKAKNKWRVKVMSKVVCVFGMLLSHSGSSQLAAARRYSSLGEGNQAMYPLKGKYFFSFVVFQRNMSLFCGIIHKYIMIEYRAANLCCSLGNDSQ